MSHERRHGVQGHRSALRNVASTVFAIAFLFVSIVHVASHVDSVSVAPGSQVITANTNLPDGSSKTDGVAICHCAFCVSAVALPMICNSIAAEVIESAFGIFYFPRLSPHDPAFQTPPPKALI